MLQQFNPADEVFTTGTLGELTRVDTIDGRRIVNKHKASLLDRLNSLFAELTRTRGEAF